MSYETIGKELGLLVQTKQEAYGDSFGKSQEVIKVLYPYGIEESQYEDALTLIRIIDKLFRIATDRDALGESPYRDIAGYCLLAIKRLEDRKSTLSISHGTEEGDYSEHSVEG